MDTSNEARVDIEPCGRGFAVIWRYQNLVVHREYCHSRYVAVLLSLRDYLPRRARMVQRAI